MIFPKIKSLVFFSVMALSAEAFATVGIKCTMLGSKPARDNEDQFLIWDVATGFIPNKIKLGDDLENPDRFMEIDGGLISGYWESNKRLWLDVTITEKGKINGNKLDRILLKAVSTSSGNQTRNQGNDVLYRGKAFVEKGAKTFDVECINWK